MDSTRAEANSDLEDANSITDGGETSLDEFECCSKLGEDLLRLFINAVNTDVVLCVDGQEIKAHK